ncbi:unnamed protein product [Parascedosporium putredinis]|uniref:Uncharacterized protein n=1 Tax=Parascedosporium putredinis TaxID=1442378 RepID=A0A9P1H3U7_9PEZI|nr:unnamed protein product [Parascedosporium putredinis]CAI7995120.1 unnamed protein product [Parascedosporium putredinis]
METQRLIGAELPPPHITPTPTRPLDSMSIQLTKIPSNCYVVKGKVKAAFPEGPSGAVPPTPDSLGSDVEGLLTVPPRATANPRSTPWRRNSRAKRTPRKPTTLPPSDRRNSQSQQTDSTLNEPSEPNAPSNEPYCCVNCHGPAKGSGFWRSPFKTGWQKVYELRHGHPRCRTKKAEEERKKCKLQKIIEADTVVKHRYHPSYHNAEVLMVRWGEVPDAAAPAPMERLEAVFESGYNYKVSHCVLPRREAEPVLAGAIAKLITGKGPHDLILVYYAGQAHTTPTSFAIHPRPRSFILTPRLPLTLWGFLSERYATRASYRTCSSSSMRPLYVRAQPFRRRGKRF